MSHRYERAMRAVGGLMLMACAVAEGVPACAAADATSILVQRVVVPADRPEEWPLGKERYVSVPRESFDQVAGLADTANDQAAPRQCDIVSAVHRIRLDADRQLVGKSRLQVRQISNGPCLLSLGPDLHFYPRLVSWVTESNRRHALFGTTAEGELAVLVEGDGELEVDWELGPKRRGGAAFRYQTGLPRAVDAVVDLELPVDFEVRFEDPVLERLMAKYEQTSKVTRWHCRLGAASPLEFTLRRPGAAVEMSQSISCRIEPAQLAVEIFWRLAAEADFPRIFSFLVDDSLRVVRVIVDGEPADFSAAPVASGSQRVTVPLPSRLTAAARIVQVALVGPPVSPGKWSVPSVQAEQVEWQEGTIQLWVDSSWRGIENVASNCRRIRADHGADFRYQALSSAASVELQLLPARPQVAAERLIHIKLSGSTALSVTELRLPRRSSNPAVLRGRMARGWTFEGARAAGAAIEASVDRLGFAIPLDPSMARAFQPLTLVVESRGTFVLNEDVPLSSLVPFALEGVDYLSDELVIEPGADVAFEIRGDPTLGRVKASAASAVLSRLGLPAAAAEVFDLRESLDALSLRMRSEAARFSASCKVRAEVTDETMHEQYVFDVVPTRGALRQLIVQFSTPRVAGLRWSLHKKTSELDVPARLLTPPEAHALGLDDRAETWSVAFSTPLSEPFQLRTRRETPRLGESAVSLAAVPGAENQVGEATLHAPGGARVEAARLEPLPPLDPAERRRGFLGRYRYLPTRDVPGTSPVLAVQAPSGEEGSPLWAWSADVLLRWHPAAGVMASAEYRLENMGRDIAAIELPSGGRLVNAWVNRQAVSAALGPNGGTLRVPLPKQSPFSSLRIDFAVPWSGDSGVREESLLPQPRFPVLRQWKSWLVPAEYEIIRSHGSGVQGKGPWGMLSQPWPAEHWLTQPPNFSGLLAPWLMGTSTLSGRDLLRTRAVRVAELLDRALTNLPPSGETRTWSNWLRAWNDAMAAGALTGTVTVWLDVPACAEAGITPETQATVPAAGFSRTASQRLLDSAGMTALFDGTTVLITSWNRAARSGMLPMGQGATGIDQLGAIRIVRSQILPRVQSYAVPVAEWSPKTALAVGWTTGLNLGDSQESDRFGGAVPTATGNGGTARVWVRTLTHSALYRWSTFLGTIGAVLLAGTWWPRAGLTVSCFAAAASLAVDSGGSIAPSGLFLGALGGCAILVLRGSYARAIPQGASILIVAGAMVAAVSRDRPARGQALAEAEPPKIYQVLVPAHFSGMQSTPLETVYVPEDLWELLLRRADALKGRPRGWIACRAAYHLDPGPIDSGIARPNLVAEFELHAFTSGVSARLAWNNPWADPLLQSATLSGEPVRDRVVLSDGALWCSLDKPGRYHLRVPLEVRGTASGLQRLNVPPVHASVLTQQTAAPMGLEAPFADATELLPVGNPGRDTVPLGPVREVNLAALLAPRDDVLAEEPRMLLRVAEGAVSLAAAIRLASAGAMRDEAHVYLAPPWQVTAVTNEHGQSIRFQRRLDHPGEYVLLPGSAKLNGRLLLRAMLPDASGVGRYSLPRLEVLGGQRVAALVGVAVGPGLDSRLSYTPDTRAVSQAEFLAGWQQGLEVPAETFRVNPANVDFYVTTSPIASTLVVRGTDLDVVCAARQARCTWRFRGRAYQGPLHDLRFELPANLKPQSVALEDNTGTNLKDWIVAQDVLVAIPDFPLEGDFDVTVEGTISYGRGPELTLPRLLPRTAFEFAPEAEHRARVFRQHDARVALHAAEEAGDAGRIPLPWSKQGRLVSELATTGGELPDVTLAVTPNEPSITGVAITKLEPDPTGWRLVATVRGRVEHGLADFLRVSIHGAVGDPEPLELSSEVRLVSRSAERGVDFLVVPAAPLSNDFSQTVTWHVPADLGPSGTVPRVRWTEIAESDHYLVVSTERSGRPFLWETSGVREVPAPPDMEHAGAAWRSFQVTEPRFHVAPAAAPATLAGAPEIPQVDIRLAWSDHGDAHALVTWDVIPRGLQRIYLHAPEGCRVVALTWDGMPCPIPSHASGTFPLPPTYREKPFRVAATCQLFAPPPRSRGEPAMVPLPMLSAEAESIHGLPAVQTILEVRGPAGRERVSLPAGYDVAEPWRVEILRLEGLLRLAARERPPGGDDEGAPPRATWFELIAPQTAAVRRLQHAGVDATVAAAMEAGVRRAEAILSEWEAAMGTARAGGAFSMAGSTQWAWEVARDSSSQTVTAVIDGPVEAIPWPGPPRPSPHSEDAPQWIAGAAFVLAAIGVLWPVPILAESVMRWLHAWMALAGVVWMVWLHPWYAGAGLCACALAAAWRWGWGARRRDYAAFAATAKDSAGGPRFRPTG